MVQIPESHRNLLDTCQIVVLGTIGPDGFPQMSAVWFALDDTGTPVMSLNTIRQKVKNLRRHAECSLLFIDPATPYRALEIRARADMQPDPNYEIADLVGKKYNADLRTRDKPGERRVGVRFEPVKVNTWG